MTPRAIPRKGPVERSQRHRRQILAIGAHRRPSAKPANNSSKIDTSPPADTDTPMTSISSLIGGLAPGPTGPSGVSVFMRSRPSERIFLDRHHFPGGSRNASAVHFPFGGMRARSCQGFLVKHRAPRFRMTLFEQSFGMGSQNRVQHGVTGEYRRRQGDSHHRRAVKMAK
jgi:hypothetical protein